MKYAIISDIHGNWHALTAALCDAKAQGTDAFLFAGDYCMCSAYANEIVEIIRSLPDAYAIAGNGEGYLRDLTSRDQAAWADGQYAGLYWCYRAVTQENHACLAALAETLRIPGETADIFVAHSSRPFLGDAEFKNISSGILAQRYKGKPLPRQTLLSDIRACFLQDAEFQQMLNVLPAGVYVFGHTHVQWHALFGDKLFINAGSCGQALDGQPTAAYTLLEEADGQWNVQERRIAYDVEAFISGLKNTSLYSEARVWCDLVIRQCLTGYEHMDFFLRFVKTYAEGIGDTARPFSRETWAGAYEIWCERLKKVPPYMNTDYAALTTGREASPQVSTD